MDKKLTSKAGRALHENISKIKNVIAKIQSETNSFTPQTLKLVKNNGRVALQNTASRNIQKNIYFQNTVTELVYKKYYRTVLKVSKLLLPSFLMLFSAIIRVERSKTLQQRPTVSKIPQKYTRLLNFELRFIWKSLNLVQ